MAEPQGTRPKGRFRRLIDLSRRSETLAVGWLEDDVHHFGLAITHDGERVIDIGVTAIRYPYVTCGHADLPMRALLGAPLCERASDVGTQINMRLQCTHLFDLSGLLLAHAASGRAHRRYEAVVEDREFVRINEKGRRVMGTGVAELWQDDALVLRWHVDGQAVAGPGEWAGWPLMDGFRQRSEQLPVGLAEQAVVLRRAVMVSAGRTAQRYALPRDRNWPAVCHSFQPGQILQAERVEEPRRNYEASSEGMLAHVAEIPGRGPV